MLSVSSSNTTPSANSSAAAEELAALRAQVSELQSQVMIERLARERAETKLRDLLRRLFGPKSEKLDPNQYQLLLGQIAADQEIAQAQQPEKFSAVATAQTKPARKGGGRRPAPEHLPIERVEIDPPQEQKADLVRIREVITEEIDYRPSQFIRRHYVRGVYAHPQKAHAPVMAPLPVRVLSNAAVGPGLLAHLLVSKYEDHLPLNRQERMAARVGVDLPRQKQCRWVEEAALLLRWVHEQLIRRILDSGYVQIDETTTRVLDPDRGGHAAQAYLWTYLSPDEKAIVFDFDLSRGRHSIDHFFPDGWQGIVQTDGYELYNRFVEEHPGIVHIGCMAHLRRYVIEALEGGGEEVAELISDIGKLYAIEKEARELQLTHAQRAALRQARCPPVLQRLKARFTRLQIECLPQSPLGKAATYALNRWEQLARYADTEHGRVLIDNNSIERGIRPTKLGLRNWTFVGHPSAGWRSAVIYSIIGTCKLLNINSYRYLEWVLPRLAAATTHNCTGLLPHDYAVLNAAS